MTNKTELVDLKKKRLDYHNPPLNYIYKIYMYKCKFENFPQKGFYETSQVKNPKRSK